MQIGIPALVQALAVPPAGRFGKQEAALEGLVWLGALVLATLLIALVALYVRKRFLRRSEVQTPEFTLDELRKLRDAGELTVAQYEALRDRMVQDR